MQLVVSWSNTDPDYVPPLCDSYWPYVNLLLHCDGVNGGTTFVDSSTASRAVANSGTPTHITSVKKFGTASVELNGSSYLSVNTDAALNPYNVDFTIEFWVHPTSLAAGTKTLFRMSGAAANAAIYIRRDGATLQFYCSTNGTTYAISNTAAGTLTLNQWQHIAFVRSGSAFTLYVDGVAGGTASSSSALYASSTVIRVGGESGAAIQGYMDEVRVTQGVARYTANFTPATAAFAGVECGPADPFFANLVLLAPMEGSNGSSYFVDLTARHTLVPVSASVSTSGPSFPAGALSVSGTTSYLRVEGNESDWKTSGELTVECFAAHTSFATGENFLVGNYGGSAGGWQLYITGAAGAGTEVVLRNGDALVVARTIALSTGVKRHYAFCRAGNTGRLFVDGVQVGASFDLTGVTLGRTGTLVHIGVGAGYPAYPTLFETSGYIGWVRVTSAARYTADFTVPSTPFPAH